jgi:hypothetical protein
MILAKMERSYLLAAHLRRGEVGSSRGCAAVLRRLLRWLQREFPVVPIRLVGDAGFAIPALYQSCERWGIQCSFGIGSNPAFQRRSQALAEKAQRRWLRRRQRQCLYSSFRHRSPRSHPLQSRTRLRRQHAALRDQQPPGQRRAGLRLLPALR